MDPELRQRRYRAAGIGYAVLGLLVIALTVASPELAAPERRRDLMYLLIGLPIFLIVPLAIVFADRALTRLLRLLRVDPARARRIGSWCQEKLTMLLTLSAALRTLVFVANGVGWRPRLGSPLRVETVAAEPELLLNAALMATVSILLYRASWQPWLRQRRER